MDGWGEGFGTFPLCALVGRLRGPKERSFARPDTDGGCWLIALGSLFGCLTNHLFVTLWSISESFFLYGAGQEAAGSVLSLQKSTAGTGTICYRQRTRSRAIKPPTPWNITGDIYYTGDKPRVKRQAGAASSHHSAAVCCENPQKYPPRYIING